MNKTYNDLANKILEKEGDISGSYLEEKLDISAEDLRKKLQNAELGTLISYHSFSARALSVIIDDREKVIVKPGIVKIEKKERREVFETKMFLHVVQTTLGFFLLATAKFDIFDHIDREPNIQEEALDTFHTGLQHCLGLAFGKAYFGNEIEEISSDEKQSTGIVAIIKTKFQSLSVGDYISIIFTL